MSKCSRQTAWDRATHTGTEVSGRQKDNRQLKKRGISDSISAKLSGRLKDRQYYTSVLVDFGDGGNADAHLSRALLGYISSPLCICRALLLRDDAKLAQLVRARDYQSRGRRFDSGQNSKTENSNLHEFKLHRPSIKCTKSLFHVIQATINLLYVRSPIQFDHRWHVTSHVCMRHTTHLNEAHSDRIQPKPSVREISYELGKQAHQP